VVTFDFIDNSANGGDDRALHPGLNFGPWIFCFNATPSVAIGTYTVDFTTDVFTLNTHGLVNGNQVRVDSDGIPPGGLNTGTFYYIIAATANTFKLSLTSGGSAIDITDNGTGVQTLIKRGAPFNLTGWTVWAWVKNKPTDPDASLILDLAPTLLNAADGRVEIHVDDHDTFLLNETASPNAFWDLIMADASSERYGRYIAGKFQITKIVTHPSPQPT